MSGSTAAIQFLSGVPRTFALAQLRQNLVLLGCPPPAQWPWLWEAELFVHAQPAAFQAISHFLLGRLAEAEAASFFHGVWPILERKQEAEFRKRIFQRYKEWQVQYPADLPLVNVSLLLTPGGPKFVNFMQELAQFVLKREIHRLKARLGDTEPPLSAAQASRASLTARIGWNTHRIRSTDAEWQLWQAELRDWVEACAAQYRPVRQAVGQVEADFQGALEQAQIDRLARDNAEHLEDLAQLEAECHRIRDRFDGLVTESETHWQPIHSHLRTISAILANPCPSAQLDLTPVAREGENLGEALERIMGLLNHPVVAGLPIEDLPLTAIREHGQVIGQKARILSDRRRELQDDLLPQLRDSVRSLESEMDPQPESGIRLAKGVKIHLDFSPPPDSRADPAMLSLLPSHKIPTAIPLTTANSVSGGPASWKKVPNVYQPPSILEDQSFLEDPDLTRLSSISMVQHPRRKLASTSSTGLKSDSRTLHQASSIEESKMSVFSPILSSSRMEPNSPGLASSRFIPPPDSPKSRFKALDELPKMSMAQSKIAHYRSILNATRTASQSRVMPPPSKSPETPTKVLSETGLCSTATNFAPIRLSPTLLEESRCSPVTSEAGHFQSGESVHLDSDQKITTRLEDLMSTLALEPEDFLDQSAEELASMHLNF